MLCLLRTLVSRIDRFSEYSGRLLAWLTLALVITGFTVVLLRYLFSTGSIALQESASYLHSLIFMLGAAYTLKHDSHVRVDIFYRPASARRKAWLNLAGTLCLLFPFCLFLLYFAWDYVLSAWQIQEASRQTGGLPYLYLLKSCLLLLPGLLLLQGVAELGRNLLVILESSSEEPSHG